MFRARSPSAIWRYVMPGGIFDLTQYLTDGRVEWPQGDLNDIDPNSVPTWVEAWVVQGGGEVAGQYLIGPSQSSSHGPSWSGWGNAPYQRWKADVPGWASGTFESGQPAMGIALLSIYNADQTHTYEWWATVVVLEQKP
jgi:hypothetical protein